MGTTDVDDTVPYTEEELAALYPNPQLDANEQYIDQFIKVVCLCLSVCLSVSV